MARGGDSPSAGAPNWRYRALAISTRDGAIATYEDGDGSALIRSYERNEAPEDRVGDPGEDQPHGEEHGREDEDSAPRPLRDVPLQRAHDPRHHYGERDGEIHRHHGHPAQNPNGVPIGDDRRIGRRLTKPRAGRGNQERGVERQHPGEQEHADEEAGQQDEGVRRDARSPRGHGYGGRIRRRTIRRRSIRRRSIRRHGRSGARFHGHPSRTGMACGYIRLPKPPALTRPMTDLAVVIAR